MRSCRRITRILALPALVAGILVPSAVYGTATHHQEARHAVLVTYVAPAPLDEMTVTAVTRLTVQRAVLARAQARARAVREHEAVLLAERQRVLAVQAARVHVAAVAAVHVRAVTPAVSMAVYSYAGLEGLWLAAGGAAAAESTAACIAEHESGGRADATHLDNSGQVDYGVMQIGFDPAALDPLVGMVTAVRMSHDGTNWSAWTTAPDC